MPNKAHCEIPEGIVGNDVTFVALGAFHHSGCSRNTQQAVRKSEKSSSLLSLGLVLPAQPPQLSLTTTSKQPKIPKWLHEQPATLPQYSAPVLGLRELGSEPAEGAEWPPTRRIRHSPVICHGLCVPSFTIPLSPRLGLNHTPVIFRFTPVARSVPGQF